MRDRELVQIADAALAEATVRAVREDGTSWLACRPGCTACCHGVFRISMLDAARLRAGMVALRVENPARAEAIRLRARSRAEALRAVFPGDETTGLLGSDEAAWDAFADLPETDAACPVLDPETGRCELYAARPLTCRVFGPPVQNDEGIGMCELCYIGASEAEILHGEMRLRHGALEEELDREMPAGETVIAWALAVDEL